jgi:tyrosyl-tRNA synthetase
MIINILRELELIDNCTIGNERKEPIIPYLGIDCTADSLHVGHLLPIISMLHFLKCGNSVVFLLGGATTQIGDPTGKSKSRTALTKDEISKNTKAIKDFLLEFVFKYILCSNVTVSGIRVETESGCAINNKTTILDKEDFDFLDSHCDTFTTIQISFKSNCWCDVTVTFVNNDSWHFSGNDQGFGFNYIDFVLENGRHFSVNEMLKMDSVKQRLGQQENMTFTELNYMILQAYDFLHLRKEYGCNLQVGGADQWGNIAQGISFCRKNGLEVHGLTTPLLQSKSGVKMGKTEEGALWLSEDKTSAFDFWQFFRNCRDEDVEKWDKWFTGLYYNPVEYEYINNRKDYIASTVTSLVHGFAKSYGASAQARKIYKKD